MVSPHCGICGSLDVVMNDTGLFVCNDCGARFTVEAMRNLMAADDAPKATKEEPVAENEEVEKDNKLHFGDADSDQFIKYCENNSYDLAVALWNRIKTRETPIHPWVVLQGTIAEKVTDITDDSFSAGEVYKKYVDSYDDYDDIHPIMRGVMDIHALTLVKLAGEAVSDAQLKIYKQMKANNGYNETMESIKYHVAAVCSAYLDHATVRALFDVAGCVGHGYIPEQDDWGVLSSYVSKLELLKKTPIVRKVHERLLKIVATGSIPDEFIEPDKATSEEQLLDYARKQWRNENYDMAMRAYRTISNSKDEAIVAEAEYAKDVFSENSSLDCAHYDTSCEIVNERIDKAFQKALSIGGLRGVRLVTRLRLLSSPFAELSKYLSQCGEAYLKSDYEKADNCRQRAKNLLGGLKKTYQAMLTTLAGLFNTMPDEIDEETFKYIKVLMKSIPDSIVADYNDEYNTLETIAKNNYSKLLAKEEIFIKEYGTKKNELDKEVEEINKELKSLQASYDKLGIFAISKKDALRGEINSLKDKKQDLMQQQEDLFMNTVSSYWEAL